MKIAVLADIHSNIVAFEEAISHIENWAPDLVIIAGDIINRGPNPIECVKVLHQKSIEENWIVLIGNHEEYVIDKIENLDTLSEHEYQLHKPSIWTGMKLDKEYQLEHGMKSGLVSDGNKEIRDRMYNLGFKECLLEYNGKLVPTFKNTSGEVLHQLDHLYVTNNIFSRLIECKVGDKNKIFNKSLSDHLPIIAEFS